ncbi:AIPR family protein [Glutamicibacter sp. BW77]|uniref:AIPR family protein n=1 Tax=Glutamicibacter sp. BW77 TaxID=2024402 RepID=UPI000BB83044|nr:AIPR family protein [Glutamicibacter sp. BW77]PCC36919.1 hypothetical protein CIK74_03710 [Glutamicibacter sp. BW77]
MLTGNSSLSSYNEELHSDVITRATVEGHFPTESFTLQACDLLVESGEFTDVQLAYFKGNGKRKRKLRVDAYDLTRADETVSLVVTDFLNDTVSQLPTPEVRSNLISGCNFLKECIQEDFMKGREESDPAYQLAYDLKNLGSDLTKFKIYYITNGVVSESFKGIPEESINGIPVEFHLWDLRRLHNLSESNGHRESLEIDITQWAPKGLSALRVSNEVDFTTYLAVMPGELMADLYETHGSRLLESNVRSYLSNRGKVNKGIRETVIAQPEHFIAYNNGITATATDVDIDEKTGNILSFRDLQIVNGGQTTASLFYVRRDPKAKIEHWKSVQVPMKLVVVDDEVAETLIPNISRFANSQNAVSASDFFSNHPFHQRLETLGKRVLAPAIGNVPYQTRWFYERTKGQYQTEKGKLSRSDAARFEKQYPRSQVLTKTDVAKFEMSWLQKPHVVSTGAQKNFIQFANDIEKKWKARSGEEKFNEEYYKEVVARSILFNSLRRAILNSDWYESGYLANIVTYTIAKFSYYISKNENKVMNFRDIWNKQEVRNEVILELVGLAKEVARVLDSSTREIVNVTEWAKKESCWIRVRDEIKWDISGALEAWLVDPAAVIERKRVSAETQRLDSKLEGLTDLFNFDANAWRELQEFLSKNPRIATETDLNILKMLTGSSMRVPSEVQATRLWKLVEKSKSYGFLGL